jgi:hypothetical protein
VRMMRRLVLLLAAFLVGASFVGVASGHTGFGKLLHSGHSDRIKGVLTARDFRRSTPRKGYVVIAPVQVVPLGTGCSVSREPNGLIVAPTGSVCSLAAQVVAPDHSTLTRLTWSLRVEPVDPDPTVRAEFWSYDEFGEGGRELVADGTDPSDCQDGCPVGSAVLPAPGVNPVINQRRTYTTVLKTQTELEITRVMVTYVTPRLFP